MSRVSGYLEVPYARVRALLGLQYGYPLLRGFTSQVSPSGHRLKFSEVLAPFIHEVCFLRSVPTSSLLLNAMTFTSLRHHQGGDRAHAA